MLTLEAGADDLLPESQDRRDDIAEVLNHRRAMKEARAMLADLPLSQRVVKGAHSVLMQGVRGSNKDPGEYRRIRVWIGPDRHDPTTARYVPLSAGDLPAAMGAWDNYMNDSNVPDKLVQLAVVHAEFESLHPFLDGNGRVGRMLVPLFLWQTGLIRAPLFYVGGYLDEHRGAYYDALLSVSRDRDWTGWCRFFLEALRTQAEKNHAIVTAINALYMRQKRDVVDWSRSALAVRALDWMYGRPIFKGTDFAASAGLPAPTARRLLKLFRDNGLFTVLVEGAGRRSSVFAMTALLDKAEGKKPAS